jgi:hypothetical protein
VPPLAGDPVGTGQELSVRHDACTYSGAQDRTEDHAMAGAGPIGRLRQREAVGVVLDAYVAIEALDQIVQQGPAIQPRRVGIAQEPGRRRDRARRADPHCPARAQLALGILHQRCYGPQCGRVVAAWRSHTLATQLASIRIHCDDLGLGPA